MFVPIQRKIQHKQIYILICVHSANKLKKTKAQLYVECSSYTLKQQKYS